MGELSIVKKERLWNRNFILLWQGQLISIFGDTLYALAIGYWVLSETGSTALMGVISAASVLPRIFVSPIAGTLVDRHDRRSILIITDIICGIATLLVGIAAIIGLVKVWMLVGVAVIIGICGCFFNPAINSSMPDLVPEPRLINANSAFSSMSTANDIFGKMIGGYLVQVLGAPIIFILNGVSYIVSAFAECFIKIPKMKNSSKKLTFFEDMISGIKYVKEFSGLKCLYVIIAFLNFFGAMSTMLILPLFKENVKLGIGLYGMAMGIQALGMFIAFMMLSVVQFKKENKFYIFIGSGVITAIVMIVFSLTSNFYLMAAALFINGFCIAITNSIIQASMQVSVMADMRSKVYAFRRTLSSSLIPIAMLLGGIISEFTPIKKIIFVNYIIILCLFVTVSFFHSVKKLINV